MRSLLVGFVVLAAAVVQLEAVILGVGAIDVPNAAVGLYLLGAAGGGAALLFAVTPQGRRPRLPDAVLIGGFAAFFPVFGLPGLAFMLAVRARSPVERKRAGLRETTPPSLPGNPLNTELDRRFGPGSLEGILRHSSDPESRLRVVLTCRSLPERAAVNLLRLALRDPVDDVRLLAYALLERKERASTATSRSLGPAGRRAQGHAHAPLAPRRAGPSHWELVYLGLAQGELLAHSLTAGSSTPQLPAARAEPPHRCWPVSRFPARPHEDARAMLEEASALFAHPGRWPYLAEAEYLERRPARNRRRSPVSRRCRPAASRPVRRSGAVVGCRLPAVGGLPGGRRRGHPKLARGQEADVVLLLEGTYPYVSGGVSSWVHEIISRPARADLLHRFPGLIAEAYCQIRYELPQNLVHLEIHYLAESPPRTDRPRAARNAKAFEQLASCTSASVRRRRRHLGRPPVRPGHGQMGTEEGIGRRTSSTAPDLAPICDYYHRFCTVAVVRRLLLDRAHDARPAVQAGRDRRATCRPPRCSTRCRPAMRAFWAPCCSTAASAPTSSPSTASTPRSARSTWPTPTGSRTRRGAAQRPRRGPHLRPPALDPLLRELGRLAYAAADPIIALYEGNRAAADQRRRRSRAHPASSPTAST